jgi:hypothetical protein
MPQYADVPRSHETFQPNVHGEPGAAMTDLPLSQSRNRKITALKTYRSQH